MSADVPTLDDPGYVSEWLSELTHSFSMYPFCTNISINANFHCHEFLKKMLIYKNTKLWTLPLSFAINKLKMLENINDQNNYNNNNIKSNNSNIIIIISYAPGCKYLCLFKKACQLISIYFKFFSFY